MANVDSDSPLKYCHFTPFHHKKHCSFWKSISPIGDNQYHLKCFLWQDCTKCLKTCSDRTETRYFTSLKRGKLECLVVVWIFPISFTANDPACIDHELKKNKRGGLCSRFSLSLYRKKTKKNQLTTPYNNTMSKSPWILKDYWCVMSASRVFNYMG